MIFPIRLPDETLCSLLARVCRLNGIVDFRDFAALYFGTPPYASFIDAQINLPEFCQHTGYVYGDPRTILEQLTWLGAQVRLGEVDTSILMEIEDGTLTPFLGKLTFHDSAVLSYCPACRLQDVSEFGTSYWHRAHQLPVVHFCPLHGNLIVRVNVKRARLHQAFPLPGDLGSHQDGAQPKHMEVPAYWLGIARTVSEVFATKTSFDVEVISEVLLDGLRTRRLVTAGGVLRKAEVVDTLRAHLFEIGNTKLPSETVLFLNRIVQSLTDPARGITFGRAVLLNWLFGSWAAVKEKCNWVSVLGVSPKPSARMASGFFTGSELGMHHRKVCVDYLEEHPDCSRLDFTRAEYRTFRWLLYNDRTWLDRRLPIPLKGMRQLRLFD